MTKYKAIFSMTAQVLVEVELEAENQTEGLVLAHDSIRQATAAQARVFNLDLDSALNVSFEKVSAPLEPTSSLPGSPLALGTSFKLELFRHEKCTGEIAYSSEHGSFDSAKTLAESVLVEGCQFGSSAVYDQLGTKVLEVNAPRGGWEAEVQFERQTERFSWIGSLAEARKVALQLLSRKGAELVRIWDYTDRKLGPVLKKEIK